MTNPLPHVLIPVNRFDRAKGRLATTLPAETREALAVATLRTVVGAANRAGLVVTILTSEPKVAGLRLEAAITPERDDLRGLNPQLQAFVDGFEGEELLILHADLPLATPAALIALVCSGPRPPSVTAVQSRDGGTNAMLLRPARGLQLAYGPGSFQLHSEAARRAGRKFARHLDPDLALDLDTPGDIEVLLAHPRGRESLAGRLLASARLGT